MKIKVLVVDDSSFFRKQLIKAIEENNDMEVVGVAVDGRDGVQKAKELSPDVITMDVEMPEMNGIEAMQEIKRLKLPSKVLMISSTTRAGASNTLSALEEGASDYILKEVSKWTKSGNVMSGILGQKIRNLMNLSSHIQKSEHDAAKDREVAKAGTTGTTFTNRSSGFAKDPSTAQMICIGISTGGPALLQSEIPKLPANFPIPIVIVQHMSSSFTPVFADRLNRTSNITVKETEDSELLQSGHVYIIQGGKQMEFDNMNKQKIRIFDGGPDHIYQPSVDVTFASLTEQFGKKGLGIIMTGMGSDGAKGAQALSKTGGTVWTQDQQSSVIYGMPAAAHALGISDKVISGNMLAKTLIETFCK